MKGEGLAEAKGECPDVVLWRLDFEKRRNVFLFGIWAVWEDEEGWGAFALGA